MTEDENTVFALNDILFRNRGYKKIDGVWHRPIYYWNEWEDSDFMDKASGASCIEAQRMRTGVFAWVSLDGKHSIVEKNGLIVTEIRQDNDAPKIFD